jgi:predicted ATPase
MFIKELTISGYRSVRQLRLPLHQVNVLTGPNGCGKSNLYQAMYLLAAVAQGDLAEVFAAEGGMPSALWAGARRKASKSEELRLALGVKFDDYEYILRCGLPTPPGNVTQEEKSHFLLDPEVKEESLSVEMNGQPLRLMEREKATAWARDDQGKRVTFPLTFAPSESVLANLREPHLYPQLSMVSMQLRSWRFYHQFRTDADSLIRQPQVGVRSPVLAGDARNLAAALQTIREIGDLRFLEESVDAAFPGARLIIQSPEAHFSVQLKMPGMQRPFEARELSDGTLRYLCLLAALLSPRPPALLALNEPETSLHPDLIPPLARLIAQASKSSQLWITTHSAQLANEIETLTEQTPVVLEKMNGETRIVGAGLLDG